MMRGLTVTLGFLVVATAGRAGAVSEEDALLQQLRHGTAEERLVAVARLAEVGDQAATGDLGRALRDPEVRVREAAGDALWAIWHRSGSVEIDAVLERGIQLMGEHRYAEAVAAFDEVIVRAPAFAEGWNKRATVRYLMGDFDRSLADCAEVIKRNPIHFGALSGFGLNYLRKDDLNRAAEYFQRALDVNPNLIQVESTLEQIREILRQRGQKLL
jgi:tetratricopeptide (TPR) repeat protein